MRPIVAQEHKHVTVNVIGCGFDSQFRKVGQRKCLKGNAVLALDFLVSSAHPAMCGILREAIKIIYHKIFIKE